MNWGSKKFTLAKLVVLISALAIALLIARINTSITTATYHILKPNQNQLPFSKENNTAHNFSPKQIDSASRDFFLPQSAEIKTPPATMPLAATHKENPPQSRAPVMAYRLLGQMVNPKGEPLIYLVGPEDQAISADPGDHLEGGWQVHSIDAEAVRLIHHPSEMRAEIPIPQPP